MWQRIGNTILRNRFFILIVLLLLTAIFGYFTFTSLKIDNKYGNTLPEDSEAQIDYVKFREQFGENGTTLAIAIDNRNLYNEKNFKKWKELGDSILKIDGVLSVMSEASLYTIVDNKAEQKFEARKIFSDVTFKEKTIKEIKQEIRANPIYEYLLYNDFTHISIMMIGMDENFLSDQVKQDFVLQIEELAQSYEEDLGRMHFAGIPHIRIIIGKRVVSEMFFFIALSVIAALSLIFYFFKSIRIVALSLAVITIAILWSLGMVGLFGFKLSILMAIIPPLMIVIGVPNVVFFYIRYHQEYLISKNKVRAISSMVKNIGGAMFLTNLTTAIGFVTFTNSEKLMEFGIIAAINIITVFVISLCAVVIMASYSGKPKKRHLAHLKKDSSTKIIRKVEHLITNYRPAIYITFIVLSIICIFGAFNIKSTGNLTSDLPKNDPILADLQYVEKSFKGTIPFEVLIDYKTPARLFKNETMEKVEDIQNYFFQDSLFSKTLSYVDFLKMINMSMHNNNPQFYKIINNRDKLKLKKYLDRFDISNINGAGLNLKELVDTTTTTIRIRGQMKDVPSAQVIEKTAIIKHDIDSILNPNRTQIETYFAQVKKGNKDYIDSILDNYYNIRNELTVQLSKGDEELQYQLDMEPEKLREFYTTPSFNNQLRSSIEKEYYGAIVTGTAVVAAEGSSYLFKNMGESILFAIIAISAVMSLLFNSWKMTIISMIPNIIPLVFIAGFMGFFHVDLKPSTLLVFGVALGITVNNAIILLAKYRIELRRGEYNTKETIFVALRETGLGIIYTSAIVFFGFSIFYFSQFGGTQAMGLLVSLAIFIGTFTNLLILPSLLLSLEKYVEKEKYKEPFFLIYDEEGDIELGDLEVMNNDNSDDEE